MKLFALIFTLLVTATVTNAFATESTGFKRPLDLPAGARSVNEEEEDEPESILFYGSEFEGDSFMWCFPAYGFCGETAIFESIKAEISGALNQLSTRTLMGLVGYNSQTYVWSYTAKKANEGNKSSAIAWMNMLVPIESHCLLDAAITTLNISQAARGHDKQVILMGSRTPYCGSDGGPGYAAENLAAITTANYEVVPIHTIYFTSSFYSGEEQFYIDLASMNQGTFRQVDY